MLRHPSPVRRKPPTTGPAAIATPPAAVQIPIARARRRESWAHASFSIARELGTNKAAPIPWMALVALSKPGPGASPQANEAAAKPTNPATKTRFEPHRSATTPAERSSAAKPSVYASTTPCRSATAAPKELVDVEELDRSPSSLCDSAHPWK